MLTIDVIDDNAADNGSAATMIEEIRAAIQALNKTAQQAATDTKADLPQRFTVRSAAHLGMMWNWLDAGFLKGVHQLRLFDSQPFKGR